MQTYILPLTSSVHQEEVSHGVSHGCKTTGDRERIWIYGYIGIQDNIESPVYDCWFISHLFLVFFHMYVQLYVMFGIMYFVS